MQTALIVIWCEVDWWEPIWAQWSLDQEGWKEPSLVSPDIKFGANLMLLTPTSMARKLNDFTLNKNLTIDPAI